MAQIPGTLDPAFPSGSGADSFISSIALMNDGRVVVGGLFSQMNGSSRFGAARLNENGTLDGSFGDPGINGTVWGLGIQADNKVLVGGTFFNLTGASRDRIARLSSGGVVDLDYLNITNNTPGANNGVYGIVIQPSDGKGLFCGHFNAVNGTNRIGLARLDIDGNLDLSYTNLLVFTDLNPNPDTLRALALQPATGKLILSGKFRTTNSAPRTNIALLNVDGTVDTNFTRVTFGGLVSIQSLALQPDGKILVGGEFTSVNGTARTNLVRLNTDGTVDSIFKSIAFRDDFGGRGQVLSVAALSSGQVMIGGYFSLLNGIARTNLARLNSDGAVDTTFSVGSGPDSTVRALAVQTNNWVILAGDFTHVNGVPRNYLARVYAAAGATYSMCGTIPLPQGRTTPELDGSNPFTLNPTDRVFPDVVNKTLYPTNAGAVTITWNFTNGPVVVPGEILPLPLNTYDLGESVLPPPCADTNQPPDTGAGTFWHSYTHKLYVTTPGPTTVTWRRSNGSLLPQQVIGQWPTDSAAFQTHVAGSAAVDVTGGGRYGSPALLSQDANTGAALSDGFFLASSAGRSLLLVSSPGTTPQLTNIFFQLVQSVAWNDPNHLRDTNFAVIGEEIIHPEHDPACGGPFVLDYLGGSHPSRICVSAGFYNRTNRSGPIIPVNRSATGSRADDLLLVLYQFGTRLKDPLSGSLLTNTVAWPYLPVRYLCVWPPNPDTMFIAGGQGSGPVSLTDPNWSIYRQSLTNQAGYNPNEEHAFRAPAAPQSVRLGVSPSSVMVAQGDSAPVTVSLVGDPAYAPQSPVTVTFSGSRDGDTNIYVIYPTNSPDQQLVFAPTNWNVPQSVSVAGGASLLSSSNSFTIRASGGLLSQATLNVSAVPTNQPGLVISALAFEVPENTSTPVQVRLSMAPGSPVTVTVTNRGTPADSAALQVQTGGVLSFNAANWNTPQTVTVHASPDADYANDVAAFNVQATGGLTASGSFTATQTDSTSAPDAVYALRNDLGDPFGTASPISSEPFVLLSHTNNAGQGRIKVFKVLAEDAGHRFESSRKAGQLLQAPYPVAFLPKCPNTVAVSGPWFRDRNGDHWAKAAGISNNLPVGANIVLHFFYKPFPSSNPVGFDPSRGSAPYSGSECLPWLDQYAQSPGVPVDFTFHITWPDNVPELRIGETLVKPKFGLPNIANQCSVDVIYEQPGSGTLVQLYEPLPVRIFPVSNLPGNQLPAEILTQVDPADQKLVFMQVPLTLRRRIKFDPGTVPPQLEFGGYYNATDFVGDPLLLPNVMTAADAAALKALSLNPAYRTAIDALRAITVANVTGVSSLGSQFKALSAAAAQGQGYVALAMQNSGSCGVLPISVEIIKVTCPLNRGDVKAVYADCAFDELLTLRHSADFAGGGDGYEYEWFSRKVGTITWLPEPGQTNQELTVQGPGLKTLEDYEYYCHYRPIAGGGSNLCGAGWSPDTVPALAEGWIKRVLRGVNPFTQVTGDFHASGVDTTANMIQQAGARWEGSIALNCLPGNQFGLIQAYETVLRRGIDLSIGAGIPFTDDTALRLAAGQLSDLYMLLGNEAYADAQDPTIGFGTDGGQFTASSIFCFQGQTTSLLQEELMFLRGRDGPFGSDSSAGTRVDIAPVYNRLYWNFGPDAAGQTAYVLNYNITDQEPSGTINATDAGIMFPQGHGDAWGHYLSAVKSYYRLFSNSNYTWVPELENVNINGANVQVNYQHERKFAKIAAARARTGAEIVNLAYRSLYVEDPSGQWQGYRDSNTNRAWGVSEWASRTGQAALFDWLAGNALLPDLDQTNPPVSRVDRTTVTELREVAASFQDIQQAMDTADCGLNPLGLDKDVVPFGIDPSALSSGQTHFEQIYARAVTAMNNAIAVFNHANQPTQLLRHQQDTLVDFQRNVAERLNDFTNRLIEIFGYPYNEDIGGGGAYPSGYVGPDLYHFNYVDVRRLAGIAPPTAQTINVNVRDFVVAGDGTLSTVTRAVPFSFSAESRALVKPPNFTVRLAPGEIQRALGDLLQARTRLDQGLESYDNLILQIEDQARLIAAAHRIDAREINVLNHSTARQRSLNDLIRDDREAELSIRTKARVAALISDATAEFLPIVAGLAMDPTSTMRGIIRLGGALNSELLNQDADQRSLTELDHQQAKEDAQSESNIELTTVRQEAALLAQLAQLQQLVRQQAVLRYDVYNLREAVAQASGNYLAIVARGNRLLEDRVRFLQQSAAQVQAYRYKDMAFRIFRNDALQKYRAQFDLAARYVYLAAKAYDYETGLLQTSSKSGSAFLEDVVRKRAIGTIQNGVPLPGSTGDSGLAAPMAAMFQNYATIKANLGLNNQITRQRLFSLRNGWFRISNAATNASVWQQTLRRSVVNNIWDIPEFQRYCRPLRLEPGNGHEPAIVIRFPSTIVAELNFFGWPAGGGDSAYNATLYSTKILSLGLWFSSYDSSASGLVQFPSAWLVPVGEDVVRAAGANDFSYRHWKVFDQKIPVPNDFMSSPPNFSQNWIPINFSLSGEFGAVGGQRQYSSVDATTESQLIPLDTSHIQTDSGLIGRSVWNTEWMLIIPGVALLGSDPDEGIQRFIAGALVGGQRTGNGVTDIKVYFQTYSYSGF